MANEFAATTTRSPPSRTGGCGVGARRVEGSKQHRSLTSPWGFGGGGRVIRAQRERASRAEPCEAGPNSPPLREERTGRGRGRGTPPAPARCPSPSLQTSGCDPSGPAMANEFAATTTRSPPSRTGGCGVGAGARRVEGSKQHRSSTSPRVFGGGGRVMRARRERASLAGPSAAGSNPPLSVRNERGGAGGGAPPPAPARCPSPSLPPLHPSRADVNPSCGRTPRAAGGWRGMGKALPAAARPRRRGAGC